MIDLQKEAALLGKYLTGKEISLKLQQRYVEGVNKLAYKGNEDEEKIMLEIISKPWKIKLLDSATAILARKHLFRKKILLMFSIIETTPEYYNLFYPNSTRAKQILNIIKAGFSGVISTILGLVFYGFRISGKQKQDFTR